MMNFPDLVRLSLTRPAEAAKILVSVRLSNAEIGQAALLLAILTVFSRYALFVFLVTFSPGPAILDNGAVLADLAVQFAGVYLTIFATIILGRAMGAVIPFGRVAVVYIWYNLMLTVASFGMLAGFYLLGSFALLVTVAVGVWGFWALGYFWAALLGHEKWLPGVVLGVVSILIASTIMMVLVQAVNLPVMEIVTDV